MKRILSLLLCLLLCACALASCGNIEESSEAEPVDSSSSETSSKAVEDSSSETSSKAVEDSSQEVSSTQMQKPVNDEEAYNDKPFKHYTFESTVSTMPELEVLTSYEELVEYASKTALYEPISSNDNELDMLPNEENRVEADISFLESVFEDNFVIAVPFNYAEYEELYYNGLEEYEDGTYALVLVLKHQYKELIDKIYYNFDLVIVPKRYYNENMENDGISLYVEQIPFEPTYNIPENTPYNNKVTDEAKEKLHSMGEGEYIPLLVWLYSPPRTAVQGSGYSDYQITAIRNEFYRNFASYKQENGDIALVDLPADVFRELSGLTDEQILNDYEIESCLESVGGLDYTIKLYGIYEDQREYRQSIIRATEARNEEFCALLDMTKCKSIYKNPLLCVINLECERDYVLVLQEMSLVSNISWYNPGEDVVEENEECDA